MKLSSLNFKYNLCGSLRKSLRLFAVKDFTAENREEDAESREEDAENRRVLVVVIMFGVEKELNLAGTVLLLRKRCFEVV